MIQLLSRRTALKGLGTAVALPFLEAMIPSLALGAAAAKAGPRRLAFIYVPNGIHMQAWTPAAEGTNYELTRTLALLKPFKSKLNVLSGLTCDKANGNGDGPGDHARAMSAFLTGCQPRKTEGANLKIGMSVDQACAAKVGHLTRFPSLELGIEEGKQVGRCDSGYSCAYNHNMSWKNETTPAIKECDPRAVFDRLFSNGDPKETAKQKAEREQRRKSILDFVRDDAHSLQNQIGASDKQKMDEYLASVREIEVRLGKQQANAVKPPEGAARPPQLARSIGLQNDRGAGQNYPQLVELMVDMMALAFQTDMTRVCTLPFANEASNQQYPWADANVPHHGTSHHGGNAQKQEMLARINGYHVKLFTRLLEKLDKIQEANGTVLDNSMIVYGIATAAATAIATITTTCRSCSRVRAAAPFAPAATSAIPITRRSPIFGWLCLSGWILRTRSWGTARASWSNCRKAALPLAT